ncbi:hypothetical protein [Asticcacaulis machinosus]|uniref:Uncharacterized protein n=1 Tax=Asticcacaulis machinosus TaxID=2984211 RepID=A0ABT5HLV5_9CAUL|nr:hypothetical protein [Asticcacaulis machinosus]MDC7677203.1 hypothetical protein [Asticcacaulis machinosus]
MSKRLSGFLSLVMFALVAMSSTTYAHMTSPEAAVHQVAQDAAACHDKDTAPVKPVSDCAGACDCALTHCPATTGLIGSGIDGAPVIYGASLALPLRDDTHGHGLMVDAPERPPRA